MKRFIVCCLSLIMLMGVTACGTPPIPNTAENVILEMFLGGYGTTGVEAVAKKFQELNTDKGYTVTVIGNAGLANAGATNGLRLGGKYTSTDLYLAAGVSVRQIIDGGQTFVPSSSDPYALEDLTEMYNTNVYGENIKYGDKINPSFKSFNEINNRYYSTNWAGGATGMAYNTDKFKNNPSFTLPNTTNELLDLTKKIKALGKGEVPFSFPAGKAAYWNYAVLPWWRQLSTDQEIDNFWNCIDSEGYVSEDAFNTMGRLQAYDIVYRLIGYEFKNNHPDVMIDSHIAAQSHILEGEAWMSPNGDWLENEMVNNEWKIEEQHLGMMKYPLHSAVIYDINTYNEETGVGTKFKYETIRDDATLSKVVAAIDSGKTSLEGIKAEEFADIARIRSYTSTEGYSHAAFIPSYANAKAAAKEFLLFMASDVGQQVYFDATKCYLPFKNDNLELGNASQFQKDVFKIMKDAKYVSLIESKNKLFYKTNLGFNIYTKYMDAAFATTAEKDRYTAQTWFKYIYEDVRTNLSQYIAIANS